MEKDVGKRIAKLRKEKGWSQAQLAEMLNISDKAISKWENGGMPSVDIFPKLSKIFNVSIDYLMIGNDLNEEDVCCEEDIENNEMSTEEMDFETSIANYTIEDVKLILRDQRNLFTNDEIKILEERYEYLLNNHVEPEEEIEEEDYNKLLAIKDAVLNNVNLSTFDPVDLYKGLKMGNQTLRR